MKPAQHPTTNTFLRAPAGMPDCVDLPVTRAQLPDGSVVISFWRPSQAELAALNAGALLQLTCWAPNHPPTIWAGVDGVGE